MSAFADHGFGVHQNFFGQTRDLCARRPSQSAFMQPIGEGAQSELLPDVIVNRIRLVRVCNSGLLDYVIFSMRGKFTQ